MAPRERSVLYGKRASLVGILTYSPTPVERALPCLLILNAGIVRKVGPARLNVILARALAETGFDVFRFDFAGVGDSPIRTDGKSLAEGVILDVQETMDHLSETMGYETFVTIGLCSGADNGMRAAEVDPRIVGVAMFDPTIDRTAKWYLHKTWGRLSSWQYLRSLMSPRHRRWQRLLKGEAETQPEEKPELYQVTYSERADIAHCLQTLVDRSVRLFVTFTGSWEFIYNYHDQFRDVYSGIDFHRSLVLHYQPQANHRFLDSGHRQILVDNLIDWCAGFRHA